MKDGVESLASLASRWSEMQNTGVAKEDHEEMMKITEAVAQLPAGNMEEILVKLSMISIADDHDSRAIYNSVVRDMCHHSTQVHVVAGMTLLSLATLLVMLNGNPHVPAIVTALSYLLKRMSA
jgi:hypothetical protein